jgi:hypothetical protein
MLMHRIIMIIVNVDLRVGMCVATSRGLLSHAVVSPHVEV